MKFLMLAASAAVLAAAVPAIAQTQSTSLAGLYGTLGYAQTDNYAQTGAVQGRLGYRMGSYFGAEGELGWGVKSDQIATGVAGVTATAKQRGEAAAYGVGFLPISPKLDLLARVGYGTTNYRVSAGGRSANGSNGSWNYGVGAQYSLDGVNGVRADYTRKDFTGSGSGHGDVWSLAYVRKF
jgi:hypothetical protein